MPLAKSDHLLELNISADGRWLAGRSHAGKVSVWTIDAERPSPQSSPATPHRPDAEETLESLSEQIASDPGNARAWLLRARLNYRWQRWEPAANDFEQYIRLNPMDLWGLQDLALTSLAAGRNEPYLRHCREIEARLSARATADIHHTRGARLLSLREGGFEDGDKLLAAASKMAENSRDWPLVHPQVPLLYRLKRFDEALREARRIDVARLGGKPRAPLHAWEAMILWRLDRRQEARQALALAKKHISSIKQLKGTSAGYSDCVVEAEIALREAETLVTAED